MPDAHFSDPRLAAIYDDLDDDRSDLDHYLQLVIAHGARSILDVGCGTGSLACRLAQLGLNVTGVDPAEASLDVARRGWKEWTTEMTRRSVNIPGVGVVEYSVNLLAVSMPSDSSSRKSIAATSSWPLATGGVP